MRHYTPAELAAVAAGRPLVFRDRLRMAVHVTTCSTCQATVASLEPGHAVPTPEPLARSMWRWARPQWDLEVAHQRYSCPRRGDDPELLFAFLVLTEALEQAVEAPSPLTLDFPRKLAAELPESPALFDLRTRIHCAAARLAVKSGKADLAVEWLEFAEVDRARGTGSLDVRLDMLLSKYLLSCLDEWQMGYMDESMAVVGRVSFAAVCESILCGTPQVREPVPPLTFWGLLLVAAAFLHPGEVFHEVLFWLRLPLKLPDYMEDVGAFANRIVRIWSHGSKEAYFFLLHAGYAMSQLQSDSGSGRRRPGLSQAVLN